MAKRNKARPSEKQAYERFTGLAGSMVSRGLVERYEVDDIKRGEGTQWEKLTSLVQLINSRLRERGKNTAR